MISKKRRGISPVLSVLLMIVVAVAGALVTYAWSMGYLDLTTAKAGRAIQIQSVSLEEDGVTLNIYVQNVGDGAVNFDEAGEDVVYINGDLMPCAGVLNPLLEGDTMNLVVTLDEAIGVNEDVKVKVAGLQGTAIQATVIPETGGVGGGGSITPPTVTQISSVNTGFSGVQEDDLLVVMPNTRTGTFSTDSLTCTAAGYTTVEVAAYMDDTGDRRAVAVLIKKASGSETGTVSVTWGGSGVTTYTTIYQVYRGATTWTDNGESDVQHNGGGSLSTSLPTIGGLSSSTSENVLTIGAAVFRDSPGTVSMTNLGSQDTSVSGGCYTFTEFSYGAAETETDITWTTARLASGMLVQIECTE